jgi:cytochrome P450 family 20 subfamily A
MLSILNLDGNLPSQDWLDLVLTPEGLLAVGATILVLCLSLLYYFTRSCASSRSHSSKFGNTTNRSVSSLAGVPGLLKPSDSDMGNLGDIAAHGSLHEFLTFLHKTHGPIVQFWWAQQPVVSISSPETFAETARLFDRPIALFQLFEPLIGKGSIQYQNGSVGRERRKAYMSKGVSHLAIKNGLHAQVASVVQHFLTRIQAQDRNKSVLLSDLTMQMALAAIITSALGIDHEHSANLKKIIDSYHTCWHEMELRMGGDFAAPDSKRDQEFENSLAYLHLQARMIGDKRRASRESRSHDNSPAIFIDYLLEAKLDEQTIADEIVTMLIGGSHTTGNALCWALYFLATHQDIQDKVANEAIEVLSSDVPSFEGKILKMF